METLRVGSNQANNIIIQQSGISGSHALLTVVNEDEFFLEDLQSTNGTWVDGERIKKRKVTRINTVKLGSVAFDIYKELNEYRSRLKGNDYSAEFTKLKDVYNKYKKTKDRLENQQSINQSIKLLFTSSLGMIANMLGGGVKYWWLSASGLLLGILWVYFANKKFKEKMENLEADFEEQYYCPKCKQALGKKRWETLAKKKICGNCKAIWVK